MEVIIKKHNYEDLVKDFVENWKRLWSYKFAMGKVNFWYYTIELSGGNLLCYKENSNKLGSTKLLVKHNIKNISQEDFETVFYETHLECLCDMIYK